MQTAKFQGVQTKTTRNADGSLSGFYRGTEVCRMGIECHKPVILKSGGWLTYTTKARMNQFAAEFCRGAWQVFQKGGEWFVTYSSGVTVRYTEGMEVY